VNAAEEDELWAVLAPELRGILPEIGELVALLCEHAPTELIGNHVTTELWRGVICFRDEHGELWRVTWARLGTRGDPHAQRRRW
jgi:hypothetical protein